MGRGGERFSEIKGSALIRATRSKNFGYHALVEMDERVPWDRKEIAGSFKDVAQCPSGCPRFPELYIRLCFSGFLQGSQFFTAVCQPSLPYTPWGGSRRWLRTGLGSLGRGEEGMNRFWKGHLKSFQGQPGKPAATRSCKRSLGDGRKWISVLGFLLEDPAMTSVLLMGLPIFLPSVRSLWILCGRKQILHKSLPL